MSKLNCLERYSLFKFCADTISKQTLTYFTVWVDSLNTIPQTIHKPLTLNGIMHDLFGLFGNYFINLCFSISPKHYIRHHWTKKNQNKINKNQAINSKMAMYHWDLLHITKYIPRSTASNYSLEDETHIWHHFVYWRGHNLDDVWGEQYEAMMQEP